MIWFRVDMSDFFLVVGAVERRWVRSVLRWASEEVREWVSE